MKVTQFSMEAAKMFSIVPKEAKNKQKHSRIKVSFFFQGNSFGSKANNDFIYSRCKVSVE